MLSLVIAEVTIEIKSAEEIKSKHFGGLRAFHEEHPNCRLMLVSLDPISRTQDEIELLYVYDFLRKLWAGELFCFFCNISKSIFFFRITKRHFLQLYSLFFVPRAI